MSVTVKAKEVGLTGNLSTVSLSDLLQLISVSGKTGMLIISSENQKREIYFKKETSYMPPLQEAKRNFWEICFYPKEGS